MQEVVYKCDHCEEPIGLKKHLSLPMSQSLNAGVALPPDPIAYENAKIGLVTDLKARHSWEVASMGLRGVFLHLHGKCVGPFFNKKIKEAI